MPKFHDLTTICARKIRDAPSGKAILISYLCPGKDKPSQIWLPNSEIETRPATGPGMLEIDLPEWLAVEKGMV